MDRKTIFAFALIILVFLLLPYYYRLISPPKAPSDSTRQGLPENVADSARGAPTQTTPEAVSSAPRDTLSVPSPGDFSLEAKPRDVVVETPLYHMTFSTRGAVLTGCLLKSYAGQSDGKVQMIRPGSTENLNLVLYRAGNPLNLKDVRFSSDQQEISVASGDQGSITLAAETSSGGRIEKRLVFYGDSYRFDMQLQAQGISDLDPYYELYWGSGLAITEADTAQDIYYSKAYAFMGGELEKFDAKGDRTMGGGAEGETQWVAQRGKYFEVALLPRSKPASGAIFGIEAQPLLGRYRPKVFSTALRMKGVLTESDDAFAVYCGPIDQKLLTQVHPKLETTMNWGWTVIEPFSKLILWTLKGLRTFIPNYGVVLIVFSVLVKVVLWPLTQKSTKSMSRMAAIQPKLKELQEKYKANPEKLNKAMMQLYKDEGVNPFSGCWPMLLQMPLLYGLFIVFRSTIELRRAPFMLWIRDLSMPDVVAQLPFQIPMYGSQVAILPILMGVTQLLMSRIMITDPKQKLTVYFMPIFMVLIFNSLPSGLNLYYALFNLWTYLQQMMLKKQGLIASVSPSGK